MIRKVYSKKEEFFEQKEELQAKLPYAEDVSVLKSSCQIGNKLASNRLLCQAMEGCDGTADGRPGDLTKRRYDRFSKGGAGIIWFEATAVMEEGRANPHQLYINEKNLDSFKQIVEDIKKTGYEENGFEPLVIMQATHSGRYSKPTGVPAPLIAYNNFLMEGDKQIASDRIVTDEYLDSVQDALVNGAVLAEKAGFDGVDIKCCHRYLNSELLSAYNREGRYGGSLENRTRLLRESVAGAIASCDNNFIVTSRLNVYDALPYPYGFGVSPNSGGEFDIEEPVWLIKQLRDLGVKILNISMGNPYFNPHVNRPFTMGGYQPEEHPLKGVERVLEGTTLLKQEVPEMLLICSALSYLGVVAPNVAAGYIQDGGFDFAGFGRLIFAYPDFAKDIINMDTLDAKRCCITCSKCTEIMRAGGTPGCVIRDTGMYLPIYQKYCGGKR